MSKGLEITQKFLHPHLYSFGVPQAITKGLGLRHVNEKRKKSRSPNGRKQQTTLS